MSHRPDYPSAEERFNGFMRQFRQGDGYGLKRDAVVDERMDAEQAHHEVTQAMVEIDSVVDASFLPPEIERELGAAYAQLQAMAEWLETYTELLSEQQTKMQLE